jgi:hypothetical protein
MAVAVAYTIPVRLRYIAVAYIFFRTPLMLIPPMTYFLVVDLREKQARIQELLDATDLQQQAMDPRGEASGT